MAEDVIVFAGPSLYDPATGRPQSPPEGFQLRPPARRGDLIAALSEAPETIVLLDGYFHSLLSVSHKEILRVMEDGVRVIGGASMGALRAAEMESFGMIGAGRIVEWYRDGTLDGDDEVAVLHLPPERGYRPVTLALVELRRSLAELRRNGLAGERQTSRLIREVKGWSFDRRLPGDIDDAAARSLDPAAAAALRRALQTSSLKTEDCREAFRLAGKPHRPVKLNREDPTIFLVHMLEENLGPPRSPCEDPAPPSHALAYHSAQLLHPEAASFAGSLRTRFLLTSAGSRAGLQPDPRLHDRLFRRLLRSLRARGGKLALPESEVRAEARSLALALQARRHFGSTERALRALAAQMGLDPESGPEQLEAWLRRQPGLLPAWINIRAFVFCSAYSAASAVAAAAQDIHERFAKWAEGARIQHRDTLRQAALLWDCPAERAETEAGLRGLLPSGGFSRGFREIVEWIIPAESLRQPVNDYPDLKRKLRAVQLRDPFSFASNALRKASAPAVRPSGTLRQYELPVAFWRTLLGPGMHFHMGHFPAPDTPLETAMKLAVARLANRIPPNPRARLLDVGAGWGGPAFQLVSSGVAGQVCCLTQSRRQARHIQRAADRLGRPVQTRLADAESFDFGVLGKFDILWLFEFLEHVRDRDRLLERLGQAAGPGALLAIATTCAGPGANSSLRSSPLAEAGNLQSVEELTELLSRNGWKTSSLEDVSPLGRPLWKLWRKRLRRIDSPGWLEPASRLSEAFSETERLFQRGELQAIQICAEKIESS